MSLLCSSPQFAHLPQKWYLLCSLKVFHGLFPQSTLSCRSKFLIPAYQLTMSAFQHNLHVRKHLSHFHDLEASIWKKHLKIAMKTIARNWSFKTFSVRKLQWNLILAILLAPKPLHIMLIEIVLPRTILSQSASRESSISHFLFNSVEQEPIFSSSCAT